MQDAERLLADLQSPYWWLTAVVLALAVNLASSYLKPVIDGWHARQSNKRRATEERELAKTQLWARFLLQDERLLLLATSRLQSLKIESLAISAVLAAEIAWLYFIQVRPTSVSGWVALLAFLLVVAIQALELLWHRRDIVKATRELATVERILQDQVLQPSETKDTTTAANAA
jgi:hypothetical protein